MGQLLKFPKVQKKRKALEKPVKLSGTNKRSLGAKVLFFTGVRYERAFSSLPSERLTAPIARG